MAVQAVLGGSTAWHSEIEPAACRLLEHHHPDVPNLGDISAVDWSQVEPVDILTGGFPCQDVSAAGRRRGIRPGTRSGLWEQFAYAIDQLRPSLVVIENVRGLLSARAASDVEPCPWCLGDRGGDDGEPALRALGAVLGDLAGLGFDAGWCGVRASDAGAPHNRFRVFIVAWPAGDAPDLIVERGWPVRRVGAGHSGPAGGAGRLAAEAPNVAVGGEWGVAAPGQAEGGRAWPDAGRRGGAPDADSDRTGLEGGEPAGRHLVPARGFVADAESNRRDEGWSEPTGFFGRPDAAERSSVAWGAYEPAIRRWESVLGRAAPAPTVTGKRGGQQLSARFVEWMMGLPAGHVTAVPGLSRNEQLKMLGNGVVPQQAELALRRLLGVLALEVAA